MGKHENEKHPDMQKEDISFTADITLAKQWGLKADESKMQKNLGEALDKFPAFPDTVEAVKLLGTHYKLIAISICFENRIASLVAGSLNGIPLEYLLTQSDKIGMEKERLLLVAQGIGSDHVSAKQLGLKSALISTKQTQFRKGYDGIGLGYEARLNPGRDRSH